MKKIISLIIVCTIIISGLFIYSKSDKKDVLEDGSGPIIAAVIDGKASTTFPTTDGYTASVECTKNGVVQDVGAKVTWNGSKWIVSIDDIGSGNVRCSATFIHSFKDTILADNEVKTPLTTPGAAVSTASEALLASAEDDYGTSYYFRGAVKNNYVEFANKCWRVVRVNGDGSVKLVLHNNNTSHAVNPCSSSNNSDSAAFTGERIKFNDHELDDGFLDNALVGFMYGNVGCVNHIVEYNSASNCEAHGYVWKGQSSSYSEAHANINKSNILISLENWYTSNLVAYTNNIADTVWCNDKTNVTDTTFDPWRRTPNGLGYAKNVTYYGATQRLVSTSSSAGGTGPSLKCNGEFSKISGKIGLLTADEIAYAGYAVNIANDTIYLRENATSYPWWSLSPKVFPTIDIWFVDNGEGILNGSQLLIYGEVRPSISLKATTQVSGSGTSDDPYVVK